MSLHPLFAELLRPFAPPETPFTADEARALGLHPLAQVMECIARGEPVFPGAGERCLLERMQALPSPAARRELAELHHARLNTDRRSDAQKAEWDAARKRRIAARKPGAA
jgi:hypothetical protein